MRAAVRKRYTVAPVTTGQTHADSARCSAKSCREPATVDLRWRNARLHDAARVKHWLACDVHADDLAGFLSRRGFLLERVAYRAAPD